MADPLNPLEDIPADFVDTYSKLAEKNGGFKNVAFVDSELGPLVYRKPTRAEFKTACTQGLLDQSMTRTNDAVEPLARRCIVFPTREQFSEMLEDKPALAVLSAGALLSLCGMAKKERDSK